jgi:hypothetical protein
MFEMKRLLKTNISFASRFGFLAQFSCYVNVGIVVSEAQVQFHNSVNIKLAFSGTHAYVIGRTGEDPY